MNYINLEVGTRFTTEHKGVKLVLTILQIDANNALGEWSTWVTLDRLDTENMTSTEHRLKIKSLYKQMKGWTQIEKGSEE